MYLYSGALLTLVLAFITAENGRGSAALWGIVMFLSTMTMISFPLMGKRTRAMKSEGLSSPEFHDISLFIHIPVFHRGVLDFYPVADGLFSLRATGQASLLSLSLTLPL
jgi:hypothetical protein